MSTWTHVAAVIRIDAVKGFFGPQSKEDIRKVLGPVAEFDGPQEAWDACTLPCGREGSLEYDIWENKDKHSMAAFTISVFGDLRDYHETESIKEWFDSLCSKFMVRQAVCLAETEGYEAKVFQYKMDG